MKKHEIQELLEHFDDDGKLLPNRKVNVMSSLISLKGGTPDLKTAAGFLLAGAGISIESVPVAPRVVWIKFPINSEPVICEQIHANSICFIEDVKLPVSDEMVKACIHKRDCVTSPHISATKVMLEFYESQRTAGIK